MTEEQQEEVNLLKELIADTSISADERMIYEDALSELMQSEKPKASAERKPKATTQRKPQTTTQRKPQTPKQSKSDIESAKAEIKRRTGKTEEECESIVNEYRSLRAKSVERKKKESIASADNKDRVAKLKKDDKIISGTNEKTADAVIESTTKDVAEKIVKEIDKIEQKAEVEATKEVKKEMPKESATDQNKAIAEKTEEKVKEKTKTIVKRIVIDTSSLLSSIAESLGKFDKDSQKEFLIKLRSDIDKLLTKYSYGGSTMGATQGYNITQSNMSSSSVNPTMFNGGGGVGEWSVTDISNAKYLGIIEFQDNEGEFHNFEIMETDDRLVFGGMTNSGFIESGYIEKDGFSTDEALQELLSDLEVYYNDGGQYTSNIVFNQRMAKGGKVYNRSWHQDHDRFNKSENYEVPLSSRKKKRFDDGGGVGSEIIIKSGNNGNIKVVYHAIKNQRTELNSNQVFEEEKSKGKSVFLFVNDELYDEFIADGDENKYVNGGGVGSSKNEKIMLEFREETSDLRNQSYPRMSLGQAIQIATDYMSSYTKEELIEAIKNDKQIEMFGMESTWINAVKRAKKSKMENGGGVGGNRAKSITHKINGKDRKFPIKDAWRREHNSYNESEKYEKPTSERKFDDGGGVGNGYMVFNYTDNLYASDNTFATKKEANNFIKEFRNRYKQQGYYRDSNMNKIDVEDIDLLVIEENFNPFRKFNNGGGVGMNDEYIVNVGNIGNISADNLLEARMMYNEYVEQSKSGVGRAGNEYVGLYKNGEPILEHFGTMNDEEYFFDEDDYENN